MDILFLMSIQKDMKSIKKTNSKSKITFQLETDSTPERYESNPTTTPDGRDASTQGGNITISTPPVSFPNPPSSPPLISLNDLPTTDPLISGVLWNNGGTPSVSSG